MFEWDPESPTFVATPEEKKVLRRMRKLTEATHWVKGHYSTTKDGKDLYCLVGMIEKETKTSRLAWYPSSKDPKVALANALQRKLMAAIRRAYPRSQAERVESWNDSRYTNRDRVLVVLDEALAGPKEKK